MRNGVSIESPDPTLIREVLDLAVGSLLAQPGDMEPGWECWGGGWCASLTGTVVDVKETTLGTQQLVRHHGVDVQVCIQGQDGPVEHRDGGPWARGTGVTAGLTWAPAPRPTPFPVSHG